MSSRQQLSPPLASSIMAYRPPHRRLPTQSPRSTGPSGPTPVSSRNHASSGPDSPRPIGQPSRKDWSIQSPPSDLRPMRRNQDVKPDEMDMIQSISRSGGDGAEGDALKDYGMQVRFRGYIDERIDKHYARFGTARHTAPATDRTDEIESLSSIVLLLRKLREGVVASGRIDDFAVEVFETSVRLAILAKHHGQLMSALSGLVPGLYLAVDDTKGKGKASTSEELVSGMKSLDLSEDTTRRIEFASILLLYHLSHVASHSSLHTTLLDITDPPVQRLHPAGSSVAYTTRALLRQDQLSYSIRASRALSPDRFDPLAYFRLLREDKASAYERIVLSWAEEKVRERAWEVMRRAYISSELRWAERVCGLQAGEAAWLEKKGAKLDGAVVKLR